jgi:ferrous iron transport protein B
MIQRAEMFLKRAGTVILGISVLLWFLASFPKKPSSDARNGNTPSQNTIASATSDKAAQLEYSYAGHFGHFIEPVIAPLGFDWKIGIGLVAAQAAREVFISTLAIIYHVENDEEHPDSLSTTLIQEKRPNGTLVYTPLTCLSILVFFVLSMQCISTLAVVRRETNSLRWPLFQFCYMTGAAYLASLLIYQGGRLLGLM